MLSLFVLNNLDHLVIGNTVSEGAGDEAQDGNRYVYTSAKFTPPSDV